MRVKELNDLLKNAAAFTAECERRYEEQIVSAARDIYEHRSERPILLISGPSGSGKTTAALRIEKYLDAWGAETHVLPMDDYFLPLTEKEQQLSKQGLFDLESPDRLDAGLLNEQLSDIIACRPCRLPEYDFASSSRKDSGKVLERKPGELVVMEGIHAFNPAVLDLPESRAVRILVRPEGVLVKGGRVIGSEELRLLRRMGRDRLYRGRTVGQTLSMYPSVSRGTVLYEQPFEYRAHRVIDSRMGYEPAVWRAVLYEELSAISDDKARAILKVLKWVEPMDPAAVPETSPLREFI